MVGAVAPEGDDWRRGDTAIVLALPESSESYGASGDTVDAVRRAAADLPGDVRVGGSVPADVDFIDAVYGNFPLIFAIILLITFVLLVRAFRSILLPLKAVILNALPLPRWRPLFRPRCRDPRCHFEPAPQAPCREIVSWETACLPRGGVSRGVLRTLWSK